MLAREFLDVGKLSPGMRARYAIPQRLVCVKQDLLDATVETHALVFGEVVQERGQALLQAERNVDAFDPQLRASAIQSMAKA